MTSDEKTKTYTTGFRTTTDRFVFKGDERQLYQRKQGKWKPVGVKVPGLRDKLQNMTKKELDEYAKKKHNIELDRRKTQEDMIADFIKQYKNGGAK